MTDTPGPATEATDTCGQTTPGLFGEDLGPCIRAAHHNNPFHRDARGAEWRWYTSRWDYLCAELARLQRAVDAVRRFNQLAVDNCRPTPDAAEHARATLDILDTALHGPRQPSTTPGTPQ